MGHMIFDKQLSFDEIKETLKSLEDKINTMTGSIYHGGQNDK